jgi:hypothetical protein
MLKKEMSTSWQWRVVEYSVDIEEDLLSIVEGD